ncbi:MAG: hypothetical protein QM731_02565 [Chitinophagaceae bacterium]
MFTDEQMEQFRRDREFISEAFKEQQRQKQDEIGGLIPPAEQQQSPYYTPPPQTTAAPQPVTTAAAPHRGFSGFKWMGPNSFGNQFIKTTSWVKPVTAISCAGILISFFLPWFARLHFYDLLISMATVVIFPLLSIPVKIFTVLLLLALAAVAWSVIIRPPASWRIPGRLLMGLPFILVLFYFASSYASALQVYQKQPLQAYSIGFWLALFFSIPLLVTGILNDAASGDDRFERFGQAPEDQAKKYGYYAFIWVGIVFVAMAWPMATFSRGLLFGYSGNILGIFTYHLPAKLSIAWPYLLAAIAMWLVYGRYQFVRVWFHLIAGYGIFLLIMGAIFPRWPEAYYFSLAHFMSWVTSALFWVIPFIVCYSLYISFRAGIKRSCPSCKILYGKKLLSYQKMDSVARSYKGYDTMSVGEYRATNPGETKTWGMSNNDSISVERQKTLIIRRYSTENKCKKCGHHWSAVETFTNWWSRPV